MDELCENGVAIAIGSRKVRELTTGQEGVCSRKQLLALGVTPAAVVHAARSGRFLQLHDGVYSVTPRELLTEDGLLIAAMLAIGSCAIVSHGSAGWRWDLLPAPPCGIELMTRHTHIAPAGISLTRCISLRATDLTRNGRFRSTSVARTLLDLAVRYERNPMLRAMEQAEFEHDLRPEDIMRVLRRGHAGSANLRAVLELHVPGYGAMKSELEKLFRRRLIEGRIELPIRNVPVGPWAVDCLWPGPRVIVELDGRGHERPHQRVKDSDRDLWLRARGFVVLRYSWARVTKMPELVLADLRSVLASRAGSL